MQRPLLILAGSGGSHPDDRRISLDRFGIFNIELQLCIEFHWVPLSSISALRPYKVHESEVKHVHWAVFSQHCTSEYGDLWRPKSNRIFHNGDGNRQDNGARSSTEFTELTSLTRICKFKFSQLLVACLHKSKVVESLSFKLWSQKFLLERLKWFFASAATRSLNKRCKHLIKIPKRKIFTLSSVFLRYALKVV